MFLSFFYLSSGFQDCYRLFKQEQFLSAYRCFDRVEKDSPLYPYAVYFKIISEYQIRGEITEIDLNSFKATAVYSYANLFLASVYRFSDPKKALKYLNSVEIDALLSEDLPFYYYLKLVVYKQIDNKQYDRLMKKFVIELCFDRVYGYPVLMENIKKLSEDEIFRAVDTLVEKRMFKRALKVMEYIKNSQRKFIYKSVIYANLREFDRALYYLMKISGKKQGDTAYTVLRLNPPYKLQSALFQIVKETGSRKIVRAAHFMMKRAFYLNRRDDFLYYSRFITQNSPYYSDRIWYEFLQKYRERKFKKAVVLLEKNIRFFKDKGRVYYWLYLSYKHFNKKKALYYLKRAASIKENSFYPVRAREKLGKSAVFVKKEKYPPVKNKISEMIKMLKSIDYRYAYMEGRYVVKKGKIKQITSVMPELTAKHFSSEKVASIFSHPKPFKDITTENIVYAVMRRESFFNPYAISPSNAVGLMQIIPPTGRWIAERIGDKDFDITDLFDIRKNIKFGRWYINYLLKRFNGNLFYVFSAYNCGPGCISKVLRKNRIQNVEEFIELIPYRETRYYVKYVYLNLKVYNQIYKR
ncbi:MAG: lytic transglycosylase domain-containing protein [Persephonella sp.]|nr:lytic transglycosylase domain-containing protein [Persephonella sp.]